MLRSFIRKLIEREMAKSQTKPLRRLFFQGISQRMKIVADKAYSHYVWLMIITAACSLVVWFKDLKIPQIDKKTHKWLIPKYVENVREQSHIFWELSRRARELPTTFSYYKWDNGVMYEIDRTGKQTAHFSHTGIETSTTFGSILHERNFPASPQKHSQILLYIKNVNNPYDLTNYLRDKPFNIGDWLRAGYFMIYRQLGLTNRYRYDQFVAKPDLYYRFEKLKLAFRISRDRKQLYRTLREILKNQKDLYKVFFWF